MTFLKVREIKKGTLYNVNHNKNTLFKCQHCLINWQVYYKKTARTLDNNLIAMDMHLDSMFSSKYFGHKKSECIEFLMYTHLSFKPEIWSCNLNCTNASPGNVIKI